MNKQTVNRNNAQREYRAAIRANIAALHRIERVLLDLPSSCNGNWGMVGDQNYIQSKLQETESYLKGTK